jgi:chromosome segregation ATPase
MMQCSPISLPHWIQTAFGWLASGVVGGLIVRVYNIWLNRRKPAAEIHLTQATAAETHVRATASASSRLEQMMDRLDRAQITIDRLREERDAWQDEYEKEFTQRKTLATRVDLLVIEADSLKDQMEGAYAYIKFLGRHPTDVDSFRVQLKEGKITGKLKEGPPT